MNDLRDNVEPLPHPFATPPDPDRLAPTAATKELVRGQVRALLMASAAYHALDMDRQQALEDGLVKIGAYSAECVRDGWYHSERLGQTPLLRKREVMEASIASQPAATEAPCSGAAAKMEGRAPETRGRPLAAAQTAGDNLNPAAANRSARTIRDTLQAISFPTFVAELIRGTFRAITESNMSQMDAFMKLVENLGRTVDGFMQSNISDNQARDWLAQQYPGHIAVHIEGQTATAAVREGADELPAPNFQTDLGLPAPVSLSDEAIEETLVPAARRKLAQSRMTMLSTMVLMGMNRIVVTGGRIKAGMNFHIATTDQVQEQHASDFDARLGLSASIPLGFVSISATGSIAYVNSDRQQSQSGIETDTTLNSEVEILFKSDYFPLERFAPNGTIDAIRQHTAAPEANAPMSLSPGAAPAAPASRLTAMPQMGALPALRTVSDPAPITPPPIPTAPSPGAAGDGAAAPPVPAPAAGDAPTAAPSAPAPAAMPEHASRPAHGAAPHAAARDANGPASPAAAGAAPGE